MGCIGKRQLIAHERHQAEAEEQKEQRGDGVLNPDDLVVLGKNPLRDEALLVVIYMRVARMSMRVTACGACPAVVTLSNS
jgi:hypothetical protein